GAPHYGALSRPPLAGSLPSEPCARPASDAFVYSRSGSLTAAISLAGGLSRDREPIRADRRSGGFAWTLLRPKSYTTASSTAAMCQASVAERQLSSRLNGGEAVMSHAPGSRPAKRGTNRKGARKVLFDPAVFLETTANGRVISTHSKRDVIFAQGDDA